jgi:Abnormal spindle-like microcephaly-assoc'd, ASPM-SPD-2-Hydin/Glycosyl hydrolases family 39
MQTRFAASTSSSALACLLSSPRPANRARFLSKPNLRLRLVRSMLSVSLALLPLLGTTCLAAVTASPTTVTWNTVPLGSKGGQKVVTLTNGNAASITISSMTLTGTNPGDFQIFSKTCGATLAASASCTANIIFGPTATGTRTATLNFNDSDSSSPQKVALSGTGTSGTGSVTASPSTLAFGSVNTGSSASLSATLSNGTSASVSISNIAIAGANAADFTISSKTCGTSLAASANCTATILFKPAATGARTASLSFTDSAGNSPQTVALTGTGTSGAGTVAASPSTLSFGSVNTGSSASLPATLSNGTTASIAISSIAISGANAADFTIPSKTCGSSLAASASCTATILFKPAATGARTASLHFTDSASNSPQTVSLTGTGTTGGTGSGSITTSPSSLTWGPGSVGSVSSAQTVTLHNSSTAAISISSIALTSTDPGDFNISSNTCGTSLGAGASCLVSVTFKPTAVGTRVALLSATDGASNSPQTVTVSGTGGPPPVQGASVTVDFGSRSGTQVAIPFGVMGAQYLESLPDAASRSTVVNAGFRSSRLRIEMPIVYATTTPTWNSLDGNIRALQAAGVHPIVELVDTPTWLQPSPLLCPSSATTSVPKDVNMWGQLAASIVAHLDKTFPGVVLDYEIWNEPNTAGLCSNNKLSDYLSIYAGSAPLMKNQAKADGASIRVGGPATAGVGMPSLMTDPRTAPYVDFYSYHIYLAGPLQIKAGMTWNGTGGTPSLLSMILNPGSGEQARFLQASNNVKLAKTPLGAKTPIYFDEYNDDWSFGADCCRNSPTYSPLFNGLVVAQMFNSVYAGASQVPSKMVYYAAGRTPFCLLGVVSSAMNCAQTGGPIAPYPQLYTYQLISGPGYLDLVDGGHMASSVTLSSAAKSQGLVATGFYTATSESILIINPTGVSFSGVTVQASNSGLTSPNASLFTMNSSNTKLSSWPAFLVPVTGGSQATFDIPPYSVLGISIRGN